MQRWLSFPVQINEKREDLSCIICGLPKIEELGSPSVGPICDYLIQIRRDGETVWRGLHQQCIQSSSILGSPRETPMCCKCGWNGPLYMTNPPTCPSCEKIARLTNELNDLKQEVKP